MSTALLSSFILAIRSALVKFFVTLAWLCNGVVSLLPQDEDERVNSKLLFNCELAWYDRSLDVVDRVRVEKEDSGKELPVNVSIGLLSLFELCKDNAHLQKQGKREKMVDCKFYL